MDRETAAVPHRVNLPNDMITILEQLNEHGYESYCVGGCVRDSLLGLTPTDWDIATDALPEQVAVVFDGHTIIPTGVQHGTVTLRLNHLSYEITTYRIDGDYKDHRRPDEVFFTTSIEQDLARRDFTMNAMAYHHKKGLLDPFGGIKAIESKQIACVGDPAKRFAEDALRILRGFRFASTLGFVVETNTRLAMNALAQNLTKISTERIQAELNKAIMGESVASVFLDYDFVMMAALPELVPMVDFPQNNPHHVYSVWEHTVRSIAAAENFIPRLSLLFHDSGKPHTQITAENGVAHFYGHSKLSENIAKNTLRRLHYSNEITEKVCVLVRYHDVELQNQKKLIKRWMNRIGTVAFAELLEVKRADALAQSPDYLAERLNLLEEIGRTAREIQSEGECFSLSQLAVNGNDLLTIGIPKGTQIGEILQELLELVIEDQIENDNSALLGYLEKRMGSDGPSII